MKSTNLLIAAVLALLTVTAHTKEIKIDKQTKQITPTKYIHVFDRIDWDQLEERQDAGKKDSIDSHVMMCDDSYSALVEIEFEGAVGKDIRIESDQCNLEGVSTNEWSDETNIQFNGPDYECTITIEKQHNGKKIRMHYELFDAC